MRPFSFLTLLILSATPAFAIPHFAYQCNIVDDDQAGAGDTATVKISQDGQVAQFEGVELGSESCKGERDPKYKPRKKKNGEAPSPAALYNTDCSMDGGVQLIARKTLLDGEKQGYALLRVRGEGFVQSIYDCRLLKGKKKASE
jgi:hypothetical protein